MEHTWSKSSLVPLIQPSITLRGSTKIVFLLENNPLTEELKQVQVLIKKLYRYVKKRILTVYVVDKERKLIGRIPVNYLV
ncbi:hypothetical protein [Cognatitamlana onchidii]|uniref:hypothetical protein n=1 Tax=Cognatitamlana onchidii TaxID=2562860 RepID=UPI0010A5B4C8|nr:hypothetical protein [Algibacter onchidii]